MVGLVRQPQNPYDRNAVMVSNIYGNQVGHIKRELAAALAYVMDNNLAKVEGWVDCYWPVSVTPSLTPFSYFVWFCVYHCLVADSGWCTQGRKTCSTCRWCCPSGGRKRTKMLWLNPWHVTDLNWTANQQVHTQPSYLACLLMGKPLTFIHAAHTLLQLSVFILSLSLTSLFILCVCLRVLDFRCEWEII